MEPSRLLQWELPRLCRQATDVLATKLAPYPGVRLHSPKRVAHMIIIEEQHDQKSKRQRHENPFSVQFPKVNQPASRLRRVKGFADRNTGYIHSFERTRDV